MAPAGWATAEEREFLKSYLPEYEACQVERKYQAFWQRIDVDYFTRFPLMEKLFPGRSVTDLTVKEKEEYAATKVKQQKRLKEWYRWQMNPRSRSTGSSITKKDLNIIYNGRTRAKKPYEIFAKLYHSQVDSEKNTRCDAQGVKGRSQLAVWHEVAKEMYMSATEEQLAEVKREVDAANEAKDTRSDATGENATESPSTYFCYLKKLPTLLSTAITPAVEKAGVIALVTIVGPDPSKGGRIATRTLQFGEKPTTPLFSEDWVGHDWFVEEVTRFAGKHEFPPELCAARSLDAMPSRVDLETEEEDIAAVESILRLD